MAISKAKRISNDKYDAKHFKYQTVKMKVEEHEQLRQAIAAAGVPANNFMRAAIMAAVRQALGEDTPDSSAEE